MTIYLQYVYINFECLNHYISASVMNKIYLYLYTPFSFLNTRLSCSLISIFLQLPFVCFLRGTFFLTWTLPLVDSSNKILSNTYKDLRTVVWIRGVPGNYLILCTHASTLTWKQSKFGERRKENNTKVFKLMPHLGKTVVILPNLEYSTNVVIILHFRNISPGGTWQRERNPRSGWLCYV